MRGSFFSLFSLVGLLFFTSGMLLSNGLSFFWLFMELCTLCLVPSFFLFQGRHSLMALFNYLVVSSVSSSLVVSGILCDSFVYLVVLGLFIKFGIFPFFGWVYSVVLSTNMFVVWAFSTILKASFFIFPFFMCFGWCSQTYLNGFFVSSFIFLAIFFWVYSYSLLYCWTHMMISSSVVLVVCSFLISVDVLIYLYLFYVFWASMVIAYISRWGKFGLFGIGLSFIFSFLFLSFPFSLSLFYKLLSGVCVYSCGLGVFLCWVFYGVSEQWYLFSYFFGLSVPRPDLGVLGFV